MTTGQLLHLFSFGVKSILFRWKKPILGTIIVTDFCNLHCKHCAVNNINKVMYPYEEIVREMQRFFDEGIRILFLSGGETTLWKEGHRDLKDLLRVAREIGFYIIAVVTNGTVTLDLPGADIVFLSLDGMGPVHDDLRGPTYETIMANLEKKGETNICVYSAINKMNYHQIEALCELTRSHPALQSISFNFHTPYRLTEHLCLSQEQRLEAVRKIREMIDRGYPVFNLRSTLKTFETGRWRRPCHQCIVSEDNRRYICGRCSEIPGLCEQCGYLFAVEFSSLFSGRPRAIIDMLRTYVRQVWTP